MFRQYKSDGWYHSYGELLLKQARYAEAVLILSEATGLFADNQEFYSMKALALYKMNNTPDLSNLHRAVDTLDEWLDSELGQEGRRSEMLLLRANICEQLGKHQQANQSYLEAIEYNDGLEDSKRTMYIDYARFLNNNLGGLIQDLVNEAGEKDYPIDEATQELFRQQFGKPLANQRPDML